MRLADIAANKHFKYGAPFLLAVVGGSYVLRLYTQTRYDVFDEHHIYSKVPSGMLEEDFKEYIENVDIDSWKNIRGPRPEETLE